MNREDGGRLAYASVLRRNAQMLKGKPGDLLKCRALLRRAHEREERIRPCFRPLGVAQSPQHQQSLEKRVNFVNRTHPDEICMSHKKAASRGFTDLKI